MLSVIYQSIYVPESSLVMPGGQSKKGIAPWKANSPERWEVLFFCV